MKWLARLRPRRPGEKGSQLIELAIEVPVLFLLIVGIWDLGAGFALKQKLTNAAREGARIVASTPSNTVAANGKPCSGAPCNIQVAAQSVVQYLDKANLQASCLDSVTPSPAPASNGTPVNGWVYACNGITLEIDRGTTAEGPWLSSGGSVIVPTIPITIVGITYPVSWTSGQLLPPPLPSTITTKVNMRNLTP